MPLFERYVFGRIVRTLLMILGSLVGTLWLEQVVRNLDFVTAKSQAIWIFLVLTVLALPGLTQLIAPLAFMAAILMTMNTLISDSEMPVIAGAGASRKAVARPTLVLAALLTAILMFFAHVLTPVSLATVRTLVTIVQTKLVSTLVQEGDFRSIAPGLTVHIRAKDADGSLRGLFIDDQRDPQTSIQYTASQGVLLDQSGASFLILRDGNIVREDRTTGDASVIAFETYALDLSRIGGPGSAAVYRARERPTMYLLDPDPDDEVLRNNPSQVTVELHDRMSAPFYAIVFALITLGFLGRPQTSRQSRLGAIAAAVLTCVLLRLCGYSAVQAADGHPAAIYFVYGIPILGAALGIYGISLAQLPSMPAAFRSLSGVLARAAGRSLPGRGATGTSA